jgi:hypothetical protein
MVVLHLHRYYGPRYSTMFRTVSAPVSRSFLAIILHFLPAIGCAVSWLEIWRTWPFELMNTTSPLASEQFLLQVAVPELWSTHLALQT